MEYGPPTLNPGKLYLPSSRVAVPYTVPDGLCTKETVAPINGEPLLSVINPLIDDVVICADTTVDNNNITITCKNNNLINF